MPSGAMGCITVGSMESDTHSEGRHRGCCHRRTERMKAPDQTSANDCAPTAPLGARYAAIRARSEALCAPLAVEDYGVQSMPDASPAKWHLAHTSWFFENFVLKRRDSY